MHQLQLSEVREREPQNIWSARHIETLASCAHALRQSADLAVTAQVLCEVAHKHLPTAAVALLVPQVDRVSIAGFTSHDEKLRGLLERHASAGRSGLEAAVLHAIEVGRSGLQRIAVPPNNGLEDLQAAFCVPLRSTRAAFVLAVFLGSSGSLGEDELSFLTALSAIGGMALANVELHETADTGAGELQDLLDICAEVGSAPSLESFLERFVVRAASFLGYRASFIALVEDGVCRMRWASRDGLSRPLDVELDSAVVQQVISTREPFWSDEVRNQRGIDRSMLLHFRVDQLFAAPLVSSTGECLGILGLLDRVGGERISEEDVRRAKALASQATVALQSARNLDVSERHRKRAEALVAFAADIGASVESSDCLQLLVTRGSELLAARSAFVALANGSDLEPAIHYGSLSALKEDLRERLSPALRNVISLGCTTTKALPGEKFDAELGRQLGWRQVVVTPLFGSDNELLAVLALVDCRRHSSADLELIQAMATHAAAALQNSKLFLRIRESSKQWAEIFDSISDSMLLHDSRHRIVRFNRSLAEKSGRRSSELIGAPVRELFGLSAETPPCPFCFHSGKEEFRDARNGNVFLVSSSRLRGGAEGAQHVVHVLKEVTASRKAERLYRELFDNIQEGAYFSGPDGRLLEVNDALVRMLGYDSREELLQVPAQKLYVDPAHREITTRALHQFGRLRNHELALLRRNGSIIYALENSFVVRDDQGKVVEYRGVLLDITEIKHVQSQLLREHEFNTQILNHTQSLIAVVDTAGLISYANRRCCEVAGSPDCEMVGSRLESIVGAAHRPLLRNAVASALEGKPVNNLELSLARGRETLGSFSLNLSPMRSPTGEVNSVVAVLTDITDVATLQAKLLHAEKMAAVGQLVSGVAHEVNNPLTAIMGFADLLLGHPELPGDVKADLEVIVHESQRTRQIVQNLLSFARQAPPQRQAVDVNQVVRRTLSLRVYDMNSHNIQIEEYLDPSIPEIVGDAHQLQQVFLNILNNACDAVRETGRSGRISITTEVIAGNVEVRFRDNGTGISVPERIFDPFYTTKEVGKGTGLGLSICYGIVREHGGEIACFNNDDSQGATFTIRLPIHQSEYALKARAAAAR